MELKALFRFAKKLVRASLAPSARFSRTLSCAAAPAARAARAAAASAPGRPARERDLELRGGNTRLRRGLLEFSFRQFA